MRCRVIIESFEEMNENLKEKYLLEYYMNRLLDQLHNLHQGDTSVEDYIANLRI